MKRLASLAALWLLAAYPAHGQTGLRALEYAAGLSLPVAIVQDPTNPSLQYVVEQRGRIRVINNGAILSTDFLDLRSAVLFGGEQGLLGLALAPDFASTGRFFVNFTSPAGDIVVARFKRSATNPLVADPLSRFDLRFGGTPYIPHPTYSNHNGGHLAFGPDNYLYIGLGDGGFANDPDHRAQTPSDLLGKMLRIDVNDDEPNGYRIPPDNPFPLGNTLGARQEIWAFGLRNPWRYSFDDVSRGGTGALIIGDVGQGSYEEVNYEPRGRGGRNYGWRNREGAHDNVATREPAFRPLTDPIHEYPRSQGQTVTGGFVYRGTALGAAFVGRYFFADYVAGRLWSIALTIAADGNATASGLIDHTTEVGGFSVLGNISSFGVDSRGELFILNYAAGRVLRLVGPPTTPTNLRIIR